jgi:hypothetical protein
MTNHKKLSWAWLGWGGRLTLCTKFALVFMLADVVFHYLFGFVFWNFGWRATQGRFLLALGIAGFFVGFFFAIGKST